MTTMRERFEGINRCPGVVIICLDDGHGIADDIKDRIFERGFSFGKDYDKGAGSGLGLAHAKDTLAEPAPLDSEIRDSNELAQAGEREGVGVYQSL
jgi:K+-sensing histidine kinase KdpD